MQVSVCRTKVLIKLFNYLILSDVFRKQLDGAHFSTHTHLAALMIGTRYDKIILDDFIIKFKHLRITYKHTNNENILNTHKLDRPAKCFLFVLLIHFSTIMMISNIN